VTRSTPETKQTTATDTAAIKMLALEAQSSMLPYALVLFCFSLPIFIWIASRAQDAVWISTLFIQFAVNWLAFFFVVAWMRKRPDLAGNLRARTRIHIFGGLLWAAAVAQMAAFALGAGPAREALLLMAVGSAVVCFFFTCPSLPLLLIVGPVAAAPPLLGLYLNPETRATAGTAWGAVALAMALCLIMNQVLRRQFAMTVERERLIAGRARALAEATQLARSKSDILFTLSNEIRNGLTGVSHVLAAAAGVVGRGTPSREQLSAALSASNDLLTVLNTTLDSESAQDGRLKVETEAFDAASLTRSLVLLALPDAAAKGLELVVRIENELETDPGAALADPTRVRQILSNLIGNAVRYTPRGRIEVRVQKAGPSRLRIEVADTGPGLSSDELVEAFQPFRRIERTAAGVSGAGLGLSLARDLAKLMGGEVAADSAPGVGSRFWLDLPFDPTARTETDLATDSGRLESSAARALRVLVAEDDALSAAMLRAVLEQLGHQVAHVLDGRRALDLAQLCEFDMLMIDARMPILDGPGAISALRGLDGPASRLPIVSVIDGDAQDAQLCLDAGADAVLRKPVSVSSVARAVAAAVSTRRTAQSEGSRPVVQLGDRRTTKRQG
jgi:signal transduction histidine kinase/FixJ family two-component response regulator